ncbi:MAG TPA: hypothetical protein VMH05_03620 [Bryobacteraceae bacterium]|nr:hypothetical protein [Bryobacteraceae bacterium]
MTLTVSPAAEARAVQALIDSPSARARLGAAGLLNQVPQTGRPT